jgi:RNA polymerase sigma-70 factor, ECF subfamily
MPMLCRRIAERRAPNATQSTIVADEVALVGRVASGDGDAFEVLYRCFYPRLRRFLERMTRRPQLVEEILNDTMLVVWHKAHTYNLRSKVSTWIFAIAYRKALKALKRIDDPVEPEPEEYADEAAAGPEGELLEHELRALLGHALTSLSADQRAVIELTYYQGCAYREIAEIMGCPVDTVKTRMYHARRKLKALLAGNIEAVR